MSIRKTLIESSFRGVRFFWQSSTLQGGNKDVVHEYPLSNRRYVEKLGKFQETISMKMITSSYDNISYKKARDDLYNALINPKPGILRHPLYGSIKVQVVGLPTITESKTSLNIAEFSVEFYKVDESARFPTQSKNNVASILNSRNQVHTLVQSALKSPKYSVVTTGNFTNAFNKVSSALDLFDAQVYKVKGSVNKFNSYKSYLTSFRSRLSSYIAIPASLIGGISYLFKSSNDGINSLTTDNLLGINATSPGIEAYNFYNTFSSFGSTDTVLDIETVELTQRISNNNALNESFQVLALTENLYNVTNIDFKTLSFLEEVRDNIETQYDNVKSIDDLDVEVLYELKNLRNEVRKYLQELSLSVSKVQTIYLSSPISIKNLVYRYYGSLDLKDVIIDLNSDRLSTVDLQFIQGNFDILTNVENAK